VLDVATGQVIGSIHRRHRAAERWFALLTDQQLRRGVHKNLRALERDIRAWIAARNDDPHPFDRAKTADEVLERLAAHADRVPGAGHRRIRRAR
jgi:hypothetical protein